MQPIMSASVVFEEKVRFQGRAGNDPQRVTVDYPPPVGDGRGWSGLQLLLLSLAACSGQAVAVLLQRMHQAPARLEVLARGERREEHPTVLTSIELEFVAAGVAADSLAKAVQMSEEKFCPVWAMLKSGTPIRAVSRIES
jgi:putative redox protein